MARPSGTVTFLFTDIEGSTRRWEADPAAMRSALAAHDELLRATVEAHAGWLFKHTGDGVCAAFSSAGAAIDAAVAAQRTLELPVRMGIASGDAEQRDGDYFGPVLNRAARVMGAAAGGQILVAASTAALAPDAELLDLGEYRLRDLAGPTRLFQVLGEGLRTRFGPPRTLDEVPGNLPAQPTSFIGREVEVKEVVELVRAHRLVTLTGVGGVGKTRLAVHVAAELMMEFPDGLWLVELAPVDDPGAVPDVVATALGITALSGRGVTDSLTRALSGRRMLLVLDNCEHVLDAAAELVEAILVETTALKVIATSREGLRARAEHRWAVPSLEVRGDASSPAVDLFVERAQAAAADFSMDGEADVVAVAEVCRRLDGIALAIELAAARMVSMSPQDLRDRLDDRFRLLSGARRGFERHQTLRHAVSWSYDLLDDTECMLLNHCSVFADGFDLHAATRLSGQADEYLVLDVLDSLVRKSLVVAERTSGHTRYRLLETIRQFAGEKLAETASVGEVRDRHAAFFAAEAAAHWPIWDGPAQGSVLDWVDVELGNLRAAFRWAADRADLVNAARIAAHSTMLGFALQRFEPVGWAEEVLPLAEAAELPELPRLYAAASVCALLDHTDDGVAYAEAAVALEDDPRFEPFADGWGRYWEAVSNVYAGHLERALEVFGQLAAETGPASVSGRCGQTQMLPLLGRDEEAFAIADDALAAARAHGNPYLISWALYSHAYAFRKVDPARSLATFAEGIAFASEQRVSFWESLILREAARVEAFHGDLDHAVELYDRAVDSFQQSGNVTNLTITLVSLTTVFVLLDRPRVAATVHGTTTRVSTRVIGRRTGVDQLRVLLGDAEFKRCAAVGAAMSPSAAAQYARQQLQLVRRERAALVGTGEDGQSAGAMTGGRDRVGVEPDAPGTPAPA